MQLQTVTNTGKQGTLTVSDSVFAAPVNQVLLAQAARVYMANERQGTAKVKSRGEVAISKKKIYKQKGTGGARHGAKSAPIFVGGGVTHGPKGNQNWSLTMSQKQKQKALISALSWQKDQIKVVDGITEVAGKTKAIAQILSQVAPEAVRVLIVVSEQTTEIERAVQNISGVEVRLASRITALDVLRADMIVVTESAVKAIETRLAGTSKEVTEKPVSKAKAKTATASKKVAAKK